MVINKGDTIKISYKGYLDDGKVFDSTEKQNGKLLQFTVGEKKIISGIGNAVLGKELGEEFKLRLTPQEAYGEYNEQATQKIDRKELPENLDPKIGMVLQVEQKHGDHSHTIPVYITEVDPKTITLDFNHPLAGKTLNFEIKIEEIVNQD